MTRGQRQPCCKYNIMKRKVTNVMLCTCVFALAIAMVLAPIATCIDNMQVQIILEDIIIYNVLGVLMLSMVILFINIDNL